MRNQIWNNYKIYKKINKIKISKHMKLTINIQQVMINNKNKLLIWKKMKKIKKIISKKILRVFFLFEYLICN